MDSLRQTWRKNPKIKSVYLELGGGGAAGVGRKVDWGNESVIYAFMRMWCDTAGRTESERDK